MTAPAGSYPLLSRSLPLLQPTSRLAAQLGSRRMSGSGTYCSPLPWPQYTNMLCDCSAERSWWEAGRQPATPWAAQSIGAAGEG
jgi:hypothetical protein